MATKIQLKRSSTASDVPVASDLAVGEVAVNTADGKLFTKHTDNSIVTLGNGGNADTLDGIDSSSFLRSDANDTASGDITFSGNITFDGVTKGIYHSVEEDHYYFDDYSGARMLNPFLETIRSDIIRYQSIGDIEYWDGSAWQDASNQLGNVKKILDGRKDTIWYVGSTYYKFRFTVTAATSWPTIALIGAETTWTGSSFPGYEMLVEELQTDNSWSTKVTADFTSSNGVSNWGTAIRADSALHTGRGGQTHATRITIDFYGWTPSNSSYTTIPLQNVFILSNYSGAENNDYKSLLDYDKNVSVGGNIVLSSSNATVDGRDVSADGTKLDGIETNADVTDATNVEAAGALMDSEVTNLADVKAFDPADYATAAQGTTADNALPKAGGTMTGDLQLNDDIELQVGSRGGGDIRLRHNGTNTQFQNFTGELQITNFSDDKDIRILSDNGSGGSTDYFRADGSNGEAVLYHYGSEKLATKSTGVDVTGALNVSGETTTGSLSVGGSIATTSGAYGDVSWVPSQSEFEAEENVAFVFKDGTANHSAIYYDANSARDSFRLANSNASDKLSIESDDLTLRSRGGGYFSSFGETYLTGVKDGAVSLYNNNNKVFETTTSAVKVANLYVDTSYRWNTAAPSSGYGFWYITGDGNQLSLTSNSYYNYNVFTLYDDSLWFNVNSTSRSVNISNGVGPSESLIAKFDNNGAKLHYQDSEKLATQTDGVYIRDDLVFETKLNNYPFTQGNKTTIQPGSPSADITLSLPTSTSNISTYKKTEFSLNPGATSMTIGTSGDTNVHKYVLVFDSMGTSSGPNLPILNIEDTASTPVDINWQGSSSIGSSVTNLNSTDLYVGLGYYQQLADQIIELWQTSSSSNKWFVRITAPYGYSGNYIIQGQNSTTVTGTIGGFTFSTGSTYNWHSVVGTLWEYY